VRIVLISDIHANWPALEAVWREIKKIGYDQIWCAGDIVGYYPWPNEVAQWVFEYADRVVMGNHDAIVAGLMDSDYFNDAARYAILWTLETLREDLKKRIALLPLRLDLGNSYLVHDTPLNPLSMEYITDTYSAAQTLELVDKPYTVYGHTHQPVVFAYNGNQIREFRNFQNFPLKEGWKFLINPGSVGQPRDGIPLASFAIWDTDTNRLTLKRVDFDKKKVLEEIRKVGLPEIFALRLFEGW
jgi:predicted phosphodiesterase